MQVDKYLNDGSPPVIVSKRFNMIMVGYWTASVRHRRRHHRHHCHCHRHHPRRRRRLAGGGGGGPPPPLPARPPARPLPCNPACPPRMALHTWPCAYRSSLCLVQALPTVAGDLCLDHFVPGLFGAITEPPRRRQQGHERRFHARGGGVARQEKASKLARRWPPSVDSLAGGSRATCTCTCTCRTSCVSLSFMHMYMCVCSVCMRTADYTITNAG
jgi:hypothetical protein